MGVKLTLHPYAHFNCTIQELKPHGAVDELLLDHYFNCTIQELKPIALSILWSSF